jgi:hypothetical protein
MTTNSLELAVKRRYLREVHGSGGGRQPESLEHRLGAISSRPGVQGLGFNALATTRSGFAWSQGLPDE